MRVILLFLVVFLGMVAVGYWQKEKIMILLRPASIQTPIFKQPEVYPLVELLEKNSLVLEAAPVSFSDAIVASVAGVSVFFSPQKDLASQVRALQLVLPKLTMEGKKIKEIDLRFSKVVIRY